MRLEGELSGAVETRSVHTVAGHTVDALISLPREALSNAEYDSLMSAYRMFEANPSDANAASVVAAGKQALDSMNIAQLEQSGVLTQSQARALAAVKAEIENIDSGNGVGDNGGINDRVANIPEKAKASQGNAVYIGVDSWVPDTLQKGEIYYRGEPNGTSFFTTKEAIDSVSANQTKLFKGLQVKESAKHGYRSEMWGYMLNQDIAAAKAFCLENPQFGEGGLEQKYIPNANELIKAGILIPVDIIILKG